MSVEDLLGLESQYIPDWVREEALTERRLDDIRDADDDGHLTARMEARYEDFICGRDL